MADARKRAGAGRSVVLIPYAWLVLFFLVPFLIVLKISLSATAIAQPPYTPTFDPAAGIAGLKDFLEGLSFDNYAQLIADQLYVSSYLRSLEIAAVSTVILLMLGYPVAYGMARVARRWQGLLLVLVILPFWTSFLIRIYAWINILQHDGLLNQLLGTLGIGPITWLATDTAIYIGIVYSYFPFMVLPLYAALERMDESLLEAAADLGEFVAPNLLGGSSRQMIGQTLWTEFFANRDWPAASGVAVVLLLLLVIPIVIYQHQQARELERA
jgi:putrescine transport system permease protein